MDAPGRSAPPGSNPRRIAMAMRHFASFSEARSKLRCVLDSAREGLVTTVIRDNQRFVIVAADALAQDLRRLLPAQAVVPADGAGPQSGAAGAGRRADERADRQ